MRRIILCAATAVAFMAGCGDDPTTPSDATAVEQVAGAPSLSSTDAAGGATLSTDKADYAPGEVVTITGTGWDADETVHLILAEDPAIHEPKEWDVVTDAGGAFVDTSFSPEAHHIGVSFVLSATGLTSGHTAQTVFTDGNLTVQTSGPTFRLTWGLYGTGSAANTTCAGTANSGGSQDVTATATFGQGLNNDRSIRLTAAATSAAGGAFSGWTILSGGDLSAPATFPATPDLASPTLCIVAPGSAPSNAKWAVRANYAAAPTSVQTSLAVAAASGTYGGQATLTATLSPSLNGKSIAFTLNGNPVGSASTNANGVATKTVTLSIDGTASANLIPAGTYAAGPGSGVAASYAGETGFNGSAGGNALTIGKATPSLSLTVGGPFTYDAKPHAATASATGVGAASLTPVVTYTRVNGGTPDPSTTTETPPTNAGTYRVVASLAATDNYESAEKAASLTINKATPILTVEFGDTPITYDAEEHPATVVLRGVQTSPAGVTPATYEDLGTPTVAYSKLVSGAYQPVAAAPKTVGRYRAAVEFAATGNYESASASDELVIDKAQLVIAVAFDASPITYDGQEHAATAEVKTKAGAVLSLPVTVKYEKQVGGVYTAVASPPKNAGVYRALASLDEDENYTAEDASAALTIAKATPTVTVSFSAASLTYDAAEHIATVKVEGVTVGTTREDLGTVAPVYTKQVSGSYAPSGAPKNAGRYKATASYAGGENYEEAAGSAELVITKATPTLTVSFESAQLTYDGEEHPATVVLRGVQLSAPGAPVTYESIGTATPAYTRLVSGSYVTSAAPRNAGSYRASASYAESENYIGAEASGALVIDQKSLTVALKLATQTIVLGQKPNYEVTYDAFVAGEGTAQLQGALQFFWDGAPIPDPATYVPAAVNAHQLTLGGWSAENYRLTFVGGTVTVVYDWLGFFQPIDNGNVYNKAKAGSAIPVKFSLRGDQSLDIFQSASPSTVQVACPATASLDVVEEYATATTSGLKYDAAADQYNYTWKSTSNWAGSCRKLVVRLKDGTEHTALFNFVK